MKKEHKFPYKWELKTANFTKDKGKVFSCFACGGGSTMGYKLAGFDVIGCNEIDPKMMAAYIANHHPKYSYLEPIQTFKNRQDLPDALFDLDILDGSPPCSSFSMAGNREKDWGKEKKFREGQADQVLDTLFFDFIDLAKRLQPKIVIAENVKGLLMGAAQSYVGRIMEAFDAAGYYVGYKLLDASKMGVPQRRERVFFYAIRKDLYKGEFTDLFQSEPRLDLIFDEREIVMAEVDKSLIGKFLVSAGNERHIKFGRISYGHAEKQGSYTLTGNGNKVDYFDSIKNDNFVNGIKFTNEQVLLISSFPTDYSFKMKNAIYFAGMSVPPVMTAQIATRVYDHWLKSL